MPASPETRAPDLAELRLLGEEWDLLLPWIPPPQASRGVAVWWPRRGKGGAHIPL